MPNFNRPNYFPGGQEIALLKELRFSNVVKSSRVARVREIIAFQLSGFTVKKT